MRPVGETSVEKVFAGPRPGRGRPRRPGRLLLRPRSSNVENLVTTRRPRKPPNLADPTHRSAFAPLRVEDLDAELRAIVGLRNGNQVSAW